MSTKWIIYRVWISATWQRILRLFQWMKHFIWFDYLNRWGKYNNVYSNAFKPSGWKTLYVPHLPFRNLPLSDPPIPRNFCDPPWGGYGYFLEPPAIIIINLICLLDLSLLYHYWRMFLRKPLITFIIIKNNNNINYHKLAKISCTLHLGDESFLGITVWSFWGN